MIGFSDNVDKLMRVQVVNLQRRLLAGCVSDHDKLKKLCDFVELSMLRYVDELLRFQAVNLQWFLLFGWVSDLDNLMKSQAINLQRFQ